MSSVVWENGDAEHSTTFSPMQSGRIHGSTRFPSLYSVFMSVIGLLCMAVIILISMWRYRRQRAWMDHIARRHGGRRLVSTYPQMQPPSGERTTRASVILPPPYCEVAAASPPPYSTVVRDKPVPCDIGADEAVSLQQSVHESYPSDGLLNQPV